MCPVGRDEESKSALRDAVFSDGIAHIHHPFLAAWCPTPDRRPASNRGKAPFLRPDQPMQDTRPCNRLEQGFGLPLPASRTISGQPKPSSSGVARRSTQTMRALAFCLGWLFRRGGNFGHIDDVIHHAPQQSRPALFSASTSSVRLSPNDRTPSAPYCRPKRHAP